MLGVCGYIPYKMGPAVAAVQVVAADLLSWIAAAFCMELQRQLKRGLAAGYVDLEENSQHLKGRLMVTKHLQYNATDKSRAYCSFNERTPAIPLNFVFLKPW
ncbi:5-methylcytosine restriction system specificity protein McrC [Paenibacillus sp. 481]|uniref:5-methylcytosine restriction system specificity protein McrC n=1 Tax=Paenibacillus sp. 481 TaxID=2835869 RepID=UPI003FA74EA0